MKSGPKTILITRRVVDTSALYKHVGQLFRAARNKSGLTQQEMANALGMSRTNYANIEGATQQRILLEHVYNAALIMKIPVSKLLP